MCALRGVSPSLIVARCRMVVGYGMEQVRPEPAHSPYRAAPADVTLQRKGLARQCAGVVTVDCGVSLCPVSCVCVCGGVVSRRSL